MSKFVLTAQLQLQAPRNANQVLNQVRSQLKGIEVPLEVKGAAKLNQSLKETQKNVKAAENNFDKFAKTIKRATVRTAAFVAAGKALSLVTNTLGGAVEEAIQFERELIKISQVTGVAIKNLDGLTKTISRLSTSFGVSSAEILGIGRILSQAGIAAGDLEVALTALAKTQLAPTFTDINKTAEGSIAILRQFGAGVRNLERDLGAVNAVAGQFAVESDDLIDAVRRVGGVFKNAGGDLNELIGLFTSVRATTRESAESIATGLRTIFTRIQRPKTIEFLEQYGVKLTDLEGKFVGPFEAVRRLSDALKGLEEGDLKFIKIAEELGGFRQIGKVIPLIREFETAEKARQAAVAGGGSLDKDAAAAQLSLAIQIQKTKEEFLAFVRDVTATDTFQFLARGALEVASAFIKVADAVKPLIPLVTALAAVKLGSGLISGVKGIASATRGLQSFDPQRRNLGGPILGFNSGGLVPGTGNRDTVPAMLTPGEFVIRRSSVQKLGAANLARANNYAAGGTVRITDSVGFVTAKQGESPNDSLNANDTVSLEDLRKKGIKPRGSGDLPPTTQVDLEIPYRKLAITSPNEEGFAGEKATDAALQAVDDFLNSGVKQSGFPKSPKSNISADAAARSSLNGYVFEQIINKYGKTAAEGGNAPFDFIGVQSLGRSLENDPVPKFLDAARKNKSPSDIRRKTLNAIKDPKIDLGFTTSGFIKTAKEKRAKKFFGGMIQYFNDGGIVDESKIGGAMLEAGSKSDKVTIGIKDVESEFANFKGLAAGASPVGRYFNGKNFTLNRQGLDADTEAGFRAALFDGFATGIDSATSNLAADLGLGSASLDQASKQNFLSGVRPAAIGDLFEGALRVLNNQGIFDSAEDPNRAFDFSSGLRGAVADNYDKLSGIRFIDAKSSFNAGTIANFKGKAKTQIANELRAAGIENQPIGKKAALERKGFQVPDLPGFPKRKGFATGGSAGGDTVPAMLTPGEFVINAKSAQRIGYGALNRMNTRGVMGFNAGGRIPGVNYLQNGGFGEGLEFGSDLGLSDKNFQSLFAALDYIEGVFRRLGVEGEELSTALDEANKALLSGASPAAAFDAANERRGAEGGGVNERRELKEANKDVVDSTKKVSEENKKAADQAKKDTKNKSKTTQEATKVSKQQAEASKEGIGALTKIAVGAAGATFALESFRFEADGGSKDLSFFQKSVNNSVDASQVLVNGFTGMATTIGIVNTALAGFGANLNAQSLASFAGFGGKASRLRSIASAKRGIQRGGSALQSAGASLAARTAGGKLAPIGAAGGAALSKGGGALSAGARGISTIGSKVVGGAGAGIGVAIFGQALDTLTGRLNEASEAIAAGNIKEAGEAAADKLTASRENLAAGAVAAAVSLTPLGPIGGAVAGGLTKVAFQIPLFGDALQYGVNWIFNLFDGGKAQELARIRAEDAAAVQRHSKTIKEIDEENQRIRDKNKREGKETDEFSLAIKNAERQATEFKENRKRASDDIRTDLGLSRFSGDSGIGSIRKATKSQNEAFQSARSSLDITTFKPLQSIFEKGAARLGKEVVSLTKDEQDQILNEAQIRSNTGQIQTAEDFRTRATLAALGGQNVFTEGSNANTVQESALKASSEAYSKSAESIQEPLDKAVSEAFSKARADATAAAFSGEGEGFDASFASSIKEVEEKFGALSPAVAEQIKQAKERAKSESALSKAQIERAKRLNIGLKDVSSSAAAASVRIDNFALSQEAGFSRLEQSANILKLATTDAANAITDNELNIALSDLEGSLKNFGADDAKVQKVVEQFEDLTNVQRGYEDAVNASKKEVADARAAGEAVSLQEILVKNILKGVQDAEVRASLEDALKEDLKDFRVEDLEGGDVTKILGAVTESVAGADISRALDEVNATSIKLEKQLLSLTQQRIQAEKEYIDAQKSAIDVIIESKKTQAEFGGAAFTAADQLKLEIDRFNLDAQRAGVRGVGAGEAEDIENVRASIASSFNALEQKRQTEGRAAFEGLSGAEEGQRRDDLKTANESLLAFTKTRISLLKEELEIVRKKNEAEKQSIEKLFSGDIEGFLREQEAVAAAAVLQTGDTGAASAFSPDALGRGFLNLQKAGTATTEAAEATLRAFGINNKGLAQTISGDDPSTRGIKKDIRDLAQATEGIALDRADFEKLEIQTAILDIDTLRLEGSRAAGITRDNAGRDFQFQANTDELNRTLQERERASQSGGINSNGNTISDPASLVNAAKQALKQQIGQLPQGVGNTSGAGMLIQTAAAELSGNLDSFNNGVSTIVAAMQDNFRLFSDAVDRLNNTKFDINLADTVIKIDLVGAGFLNSLADGLKKELFREVSRQLLNFEIKPNGDIGPKN